MLGLILGESIDDVWQHQSLQDFGNQAREGDLAVGGTLADRFAGFQDGDDDGSLPDGWNDCIAHRQVVELSKVIDCPWAKMLQVNGC